MVALGQATPNDGNDGNESDLCEVINMADSTSSCNNLPAYPLSLILTTGQVVNNVPIIAGGAQSGNRVSNFCPPSLQVRIFSISNSEKNNHSNSKNFKILYCF